MGQLHPIAKPWGHTYRLGPAHFADIKKGGTSSRHNHPRDVNGFFVVKGKLKIVQDVGGEIILHDRDFLQVEARNWHRFEALEDTWLIETYVPDDGIIREQHVT